jgi:hypothetical protein
MGNQVNGFSGFLKNFIHIFHPSDRSNSNLVRRLTAATVIINLLAYGMIGFWLYKDRLHYQRLAEVTTQNMAKVLEANISGVFDKFDLALYALAHETERHLARGRINEPELNGYIHRLLSKLPELFDMSVADAGGNVLYGTNIIAGRSVNVRDRDYFVYLRSNPNNGMKLSQLLHGRVSGRWSIALARRINHADGSFAGVAIGLFDVNYFDKLFSGLEVGKQGAIIIRDSEFNLIALKPKGDEPGSRIGSRVLSKKTRDMITGNATAATYRIVAPRDNTERLISFRKAARYPFYIMAASATNDYMAPWRNEAVVAFVLVVIFTLATVISSRKIFKSRETELLHAESQRYGEMMRQQNEELNEALARVKRLEGIIPICTYCKKICNEQQSWEQLEKYITEHSDALFSHGMCPDCAEEQMANLFPDPKPDIGH